MKLAVLLQVQVPNSVPRAPPSLVIGPQTITYARIKIESEIHLDFCFSNQTGLRGSSGSHAGCHADRGFVA